MDLSAWVSAGAAVVSAAFAAVSVWQSSRAQTLNAQTADASKKQAHAVAMKEARINQRLHVDSTDHSTLRIWNPGIADLDRVIVENYAVGKHPLEIRNLSAGEFKSVPLIRRPVSGDDLRCEVYRKGASLPDRQCFDFSDIGIPTVRPPSF